MLTKHQECASTVLGTLCAWSQCYRKDPEKRFNVCWNSLTNQLLYTFSLLFSRAEISLFPFFKPRVPDSMLNMLEIQQKKKERREEGRRVERAKEWGKEGKERKGNICDPALYEIARKCRYACVYVCVQSLSHVQTLCDPMDSIHQALLSMGILQAQIWSRLSFPTPACVPVYIYIYIYICVCVCVCVCVCMYIHVYVCV